MKINRLNRRTVWIVGFVVLAACVGSFRSIGEEIPSPPTPGRFTIQIESGGFERQAVVQIPPAYRHGEKLSLVVTLHGAGGNGEQFLESGGWVKKADEQGFIALAPSGLPSLPNLVSNFRLNPQVWNSGQLNQRSPRAKIDDVAFISELLDELQRRVGFDESRVYATGHSNGAGMIFRLGAELSERFTAIAPVAGSMSLVDPKPKKPLPTLYIIGTVDPLQPLEGGEVKLPWGTRTNVPVMNYLTGWAAAIDCQSDPRTVSDDAKIKKFEFPSKADGPSLTAIYVKGQGHGWPGGSDGLPERLIGPATKNLDATGAIWDFFKSISKRDGS